MYETSKCKDCAFLAREKMVPKDGGYRSSIPTCLKNENIGADYKESCTPFLDESDPGAASAKQTAFASDYVYAEQVKNYIAARSNDQVEKIFEHMTIRYQPE